MPTVGIVTKVGRKVPMILPIVLKAFKFPTTRPLCSRLSVAYFTSDGVTVPSKNSGATKIAMHERNAAQIKRFVSIATISTPATAIIRYFPSTGIAPIHSAAKINRR